MTTTSNTPETQAPEATELHETIMGLDSMPVRDLVRFLRTRATTVDGDPVGAVTMTGAQLLAIASRLAR